MTTQGALKLPVITSPSEAARSSQNDDRDVRNVAAQDIPYYTPAQQVAPGTAVDPQPTGQPIPKLFTPVTIRGVTLQNRIWVSPMCQYSAHEGFHSPWHLAHYGSIAMRGPGLVMIEASAVQPNGRITPEDSGIWLDSHADMLRKHAELAHSQNIKIGIQLAHAGRKASTVAPWLSSSATATREVGGWPDDVVGATNEPFNDEMPVPRAITIPEIEQLKQDYVLAALRAVRAGIDVIELHFAHGYLVSTFLSPATNKRTDAYGGSFDNRSRLSLEIIDAIRAVIPKQTPLFVRISATDWLDNNPEYEGESWTVDDSAKLAAQFADHGVDVLDVSSGGNHKLQKPVGAPGYQAPFAKAIKKHVGDKLLVSAVGSIKTGDLAEEIIAGGKGGDDVPLDLIAAGRMFQKNPGLVWAWADDLQTTIQVAHQIGWGFKGRKKGTSQNVV